MPKGERRGDPEPQRLSNLEVAVRLGAISAGGVAGVELAKLLAFQIRTGTVDPLDVALFIGDTFLTLKVFLDSIRRMPSPDDYDP